MSSFTVNEGTGMKIRIYNILLNRRSLFLIFNEDSFFEGFVKGGTVTAWQRSCYCKQFGGQFDNKM